MSKKTSPPVYTKICAKCGEEASGSVPESVDEVMERHEKKKHTK